MFIYIHIYIYLYFYLHICIYIFIYRQIDLDREIERERSSAWRVASFNCATYLISILPECESKCERQSPSPLRPSSDQRSVSSIGTPPIPL